MNNIEFCPFCGSEKVRPLFDREFVVENPLRATCLNCGAKGPASFYKKVAIKKWNNRCSKNKKSTVFLKNKRSRFDMMDID